LKIKSFLQDYYKGNKQYDYRVGEEVHLIAPTISIVKLI
jgi:hypothetical protein